MKNYMQLVKAIEEMDLGDTIESNERGFVFFMDDDETLRFHDKTGQEVNLKRSLFRLSWTIIKAETNVLTAKQLIETIEPKAEIRNAQGRLYGHDDMVMMFEKGKTAEWLRHKELRSWAGKTREYLYKNETGSGEGFQMLDKILNNLERIEQ